VISRREALAMHATPHLSGGLVEAIRIVPPNAGVGSVRVGSVRRSGSVRSAGSRDDTNRGRGGDHANVNGNASTTNGNINGDCTSPAGDNVAKSSITSPGPGTNDRNTSNNANNNTNSLTPNLTTHSKTKSQEPIANAESLLNRTGANRTTAKGTALNKTTARNCTNQNAATATGSDPTQNPPPSLKWEQVHFIIGQGKTKLCHYFERGMCHNAIEDCPFAHGEADLRVKPNLTKTR
jgi:hypothetical protein